MLFFYSSAHGHLGCFLLLVIMKTAIINANIQVFESLLLFLLVIYPEVEFLDHIMILLNSVGVFHDGHNTQV